MLHIYTDCSSSYLTHSTYCLEIITINTFISVNCWWTSTWVLLFYSYVINMSCAEWNPESLSECGLLWFKKHGRYHTKSSLDKSLGPIWPFTWNLNVNVNGLPSNWLFSCRLIFPLSLLLEHNKCAPPIIIAGWYLRHPPGLSLASRRQWHQKKKKKERKRKEKKLFCLYCPPSPYSGATWNCLKRWAVIKYCRADIMTGKIKGRKQKKKKRPDQFSSHNASPNPLAQPSLYNKRHQATDRTLVSNNFAAMIFSSNNAETKPAHPCK